MTMDNAIVEQDIPGLDATVAQRDTINLKDALVDINVDFISKVR